MLKLEPHKALSQRMEHLKHVKHLEDVLKSFFYLEDANIFFAIIARNWSSPIANLCTKTLDQLLHGQIRINDLPPLKS